MSRRFFGSTRGISTFEISELLLALTYFVLVFCHQPSFRSYLTIQFNQTVLHKICSDRRTALHVAASEGHLDIVRLLVHRGARINRSDRWGGSPLDDAHRHRQTEVATYLRQKGGSTGSADQTSNLITAAAQGDLDEVRMLLTPLMAVIPNRDALGDSSSSARHIGNSSGGAYSIGASASGRSFRRMGSHHGKGGGKGGQKKALEILPPVDINAGDYDKRTALHLAAGEGHTDVVQLLCERGANVNIEDRWGGRPLDGKYDVNCLRITQAACSAVLETLFWHMILFSHTFVA